jgi:hypothetical protein
MARSSGSCAASHWKARETNVSVARLTEWRERALAGAVADTVFFG